MKLWGPINCISVSGRIVMGISVGPCKRIPPTHKADSVALNYVEDFHQEVRTHITIIISEGDNLTGRFDDTSISSPAKTWFGFGYEEDHAKSRPFSKTPQQICRSICRTVVNNDKFPFAW